MANPVVKLYLFAYNLLSALGWANVLLITVQSLLAGLSPADFWASVDLPLKVAQTAAFLEILHSLFKLVRSPLLTATLQVGSRLWLLWFYSAVVPECQTHFSLYLMVGSWACVEVPRYLFYSINLYVDKVPFPIFWLRYSLFAVLYPTGVSGELLQMWTSLPVYGQTWPVFRLVTYFILSLYVPGGPFMYFHMVKQRGKAYKSRFAPPKRAPEGLVWPVTDAKKDERSTTVTNKAIWSGSLQNVAPAESKKVDAERKWRFKYQKYVMKNVEIAAKNPADCLQIAEDGLAAARKQFEFIRGGQTCSFGEAMDGRFKGSFLTRVLKGDKPKPAAPQVEVPYKGTTLTEDALIKQLAKWSDYGTIEPSCRDAISWLAQNPGALDLSDRYFVLLGAGSAMGPIKVLLSLGANIIAVDLDRKGIWERLLNMAKNSPGTMIYPLKKEPKGESISDHAEVAGCNLFTQTPEIRNWLLEVEQDKPITVGGYAYLDGALHVQVSLAMVEISRELQEKREKPVMVAFLCSPTDVFIAPPEARAAMESNRKNAPFWQGLFTSKLRPNAQRTFETPSGQTISLVNGIVVAQGPNYALAKRLQHWLCVIARSKGHGASSNIAPSTSTVSVTSNKMFALAYEGMANFKPMEIMAPETSNAVMGALLLHDVLNPKSSAQPNSKLSLDTPLGLFSEGAFHGGVWRNGFLMNTIGELSAISYMVTVPALQAGVVGVLAFGYYAATQFAWP